MSFNSTDNICVGGFNRGKRRFARQGLWRTSDQQQNFEPLFWLPPAPLPATPPLAPVGVAHHKPRLKDEYHLAELAGEFWGRDVTSVYSPELIIGVYGTLQKTG